MASSSRTPEIGAKINLFSLLKKGWISYLHTPAKGSDLASSSRSRLKGGNIQSSSNSQRTLKRPSRANESLSDSFNESVTFPIDDNPQVALLENGARLNWHSSAKGSDISTRSHTPEIMQKSIATLLQKGVVLAASCRSSEDESDI